MIPSERLHVEQEIGQLEVLDGDLAAFDLVRLRSPYWTNFELSALSTHSRRYLRS